MMRRSVMLWTTILTVMSHGCCLADRADPEPRVIEFSSTEGTKSERSIFDPLGYDDVAFAWNRESTIELAGGVFDPGDEPALWFFHAGPFDHDGDKQSVVVGEIAVLDPDGRELHRKTTSLYTELSPGHPFFSFGLNVETHRHWAPGLYTARATVRDGLTGDEFTYEAPFSLR